MFKRLFVIIFVSFFVVIPKADEKKLTEEQAIKELQKTQVQIEVAIPYRDGGYGRAYGSGTVIAKTDNVYFVHTGIHIVSTIEIVLVDYKEARIKIDIFGKHGSRAEAEIVAWNWRTDGLLLKVEIPERELKNFDEFKVAKIADRLPISSVEEKFSDLLADYVYLGGYPRLELADSSGKVTQYIYNERFGSERTYQFVLLKTMHVSAEGLVGPGQSGGGIFILNEKTGRPEWAGTSTLSDGQLIIGVSVDVTVEAFLKQVPELKGLIDFPKFKFEYPVVASSTINYKELKEKQRQKNIN